MRSPAIRQRLAGRARRLQMLQRQLDALDLGRRLASVGTKLVAGDARLARAIASRRHRADRQLRDAAARLDSLSPLAVLGRGYAVCWNADRTRVIAMTPRGALPGDRVRVTFARGRARMPDRTGTMTDTTIKDFEGAIAELESIVKKLEEGELPLEQSLALYERGVQLSRFCHARWRTPNAGSKS